MVFKGLFNDLPAEQATALLSCFVFQENSSEMPKLTEQLAGPLRQMQECAKRIAKVSAETKLEIDEDTYLSSLNPQPMDVVCTWATGATSVHICRMTAVAEGSTVHWMRRLGRTASTDVSSSKSRWKRGAGEQICWSHQNQKGYCICCLSLLIEFNINHHLSV